MHEDARWFIEGLTQYYGIVLAERASLISQDEALQHFGDLYGEARYIEQQEGPRSLADASLRYGDPTDRYAGRIVYAKGALLGWQLQRLLSEKGGSLDEVMAVILQRRRTPLDTEAIQAVFHQVYAGTVDNLLNTWLNDVTPLQEMPLPPATGESGDAKFLPGLQD